MAQSRARAIDDLIDELDPLFVDGRIKEAQALLRSLATSDASLAILLSALVVSHPWRVALGDARLCVVDAAHRAARRDGGEALVRKIARFM